MRLDTFAPGCCSELEHPTLRHPVSPIRVSALDATKVTRSDEQDPCDRDCMVTLACALFIALAQMPPDRAFSSGRRGGCQNCGPFLGTPSIRCRITIGTQKGTRILTSIHVVVKP